MNYTMCLGDVIWQKSRIVPVLKLLARMYGQGRRPITLSVLVMLQLIRICHLPVERYFNPNLIQENSEVRRRVRHKTQLCPEKYLPIVEATLDGAINMKE